VNSIISSSPNAQKMSIHAKPKILIRKFIGFHHNKANKTTLNWQNDFTFL